MATQVDILTENGGSLSDRVYLSVRSAILSLDMPPGLRIDKKAMARDLGVSLSPLSEALSRLSAEGLVDVYPQAGTYVASFSMQEIREGAFLREALEVAAVECVAANATDLQIADLLRNFRIQEVLAEEGDCAGFFRLDEEMHNILLNATGFPKLLKLIDTTGLQTERARRLIAKTPGSALIALEEHRLIVDGIVRHDPEQARSGMKNHLKRVVYDLTLLDQSRPDLFERVRSGGRRKA